MPFEVPTETVPAMLMEHALDSAAAGGVLRLILVQGQMDGRTRVRVGDSGRVVGRHTLASGERVDPHLSRQHASITREGDDWVLKDLGSRNRSRVNGKEITEPVKLHAG